MLWNGSFQPTLQTSDGRDIGSLKPRSDLCVLSYVCPHRVVLEDLAHGPRPVCGPVRCNDSGQHIPGGVRLQERQVCTQAQVSRRAALLIIFTRWGKAGWKLIFVCFKMQLLNESNIFYPSRVAQKREDAVSKEVTRKLSEADNRKMSRKEKDERWSMAYFCFVFLVCESNQTGYFSFYAALRMWAALVNRSFTDCAKWRKGFSQVSPPFSRILWKKNEVADYEATTFSIFYNNTLFLVLVIVASFFLLKNFNPTVYPFIYQFSAYWLLFVDNLL